MRLRRKHLLPVHRWTGLTLGLIAMLSAFTGAGMAFRTELEPLLYPHVARGGTCTQPLPLDRFITAAKAAHPTGRIDYIRVRTSDDSPIAVRFFDKDTLYFDRCSGALGASQNRYAGVFGTLEWLHRGQWLPDIGGWIMGLGALSLLLVLIGIGVYLWWPRSPRRFSQALKLDRRLKGPAFTLGLHRSVGAWAAIPLLLSAITGLPNAFEFLQKALIAAGAPKHERLPKITGPGGEIAPAQVDQAWSTVMRLTNNPGEVLIHVAPAAGKPVEIYAIEADAPHANARSYVYLEPHSGAVLRYAPYRSSGLGSRIYYWMLSIHTGALGLVPQLVIFLGAIGGLTLGYTGLSSYWRRWARKRRAAAKRPAPQPRTSPAE